MGLDNPRRITYDRLHKVIGVAFTRTETVQVGNLETPKCFLRLLDACSFTCRFTTWNLVLSILNNTSLGLTQFDCEPDEEITALETMLLNVDGHFMSCICVGTFSYQADEREPTEGRLLVFFAAHAVPPSSQQLSLLTSTQAQGCVYAIANAQGMIAAAVNASVCDFQRHLIELIQKISRSLSIALRNQITNPHQLMF